MCTRGADFRYREFSGKDPPDATRGSGKPRLMRPPGYSTNLSGARMRRGQEAARAGLPPVLTAEAQGSAARGGAAPTAIPRRSARRRGPGHRGQGRARSVLSEARRGGGGGDACGGGGREAGGRGGGQQGCAARG